MTEDRNSISGLHIFLRRPLRYSWIHFKLMEYIISPTCYLWIAPFIRALTEALKAFVYKFLSFYRGTRAGWLVIVKSECRDLHYLWVVFDWPYWSKPLIITVRVTHKLESLCLDGILRKIQPYFFTILHVHMHGHVSHSPEDWWRLRGLEETVVNSIEH